MRRRSVLLLLAMALPMMFAPVVAATSGQTPDSLGETIGWNVATDPTNLLAQTFTTPNKVERLDYLEVFAPGSTNGATVEAWVKAGAPGTSGIAGTDATANLTAGWTNAWLKLTPATSVVLAANSVYSVMFRVTDPTHKTTLGGENHPEYYPYGAAYGYDGAAWSTPAPGDSQDLAFQVFMSPVPGYTDQHQNVHDTPVGLAVTAQTFVAGVTGYLGAVSLWTNGTNGASSVTVEICSVTSGLDCAGPTQALAAEPALAPGVIASATVVVNAASAQWIDFVFGTPPAIVSGTTYAIVVLGAAGWAGSAANTYGSGQGLWYEGSWAGILGSPVFDLTFQTFVTSGGSTPPPTSTGAAPAGSGSSAPLPLLIVLAAAALGTGGVLAGRHGLVSRR